MRRTAIIIALILALGLVLVPSSAAAQGVSIVGKTGDDGAWVGLTWKVDIYPGEEKSTTISLYNPTILLASVEATVVPESLDDGNLVFGLSQSSFVMPGRTHADVVLSVKASPSATSGTYTAELKIKSEVPSSPVYYAPGPVAPLIPTPALTPTPTPPIPTPTPTSTPPPTPTPPAPVSLETIVLTPESASIAVDQTQQFRAEGIYSDGSTADITAEATWSSSDTAVATIEAGLATGVDIGTAEVTAALDGIISDPATLTVTAPVVAPWWIAGVIVAAALAAGAALFAVRRRK